MTDMRRLARIMAEQKDWEDMRTIRQVLEDGGHDTRQTERALQRRQLADAERRGYQRGLREDGSVGRVTSYSQMMWSEPRHRKVTVQRHSTTFHVVMSVVTCGLWLPVWLLSRRTWQTRTVTK